MSYEIRPNDLYEYYSTEELEIALYNVERRLVMYYLLSSVELTDMTTVSRLESEESRIKYELLRRNEYEL